MNKYLRRAIRTGLLAMLMSGLAGQALLYRNRGRYGPPKDRPYRGVVFRPEPPPPYSEK